MANEQKDSERKKKCLKISQLVIFLRYFGLSKKLFLSKDFVPGFVLKSWSPVPLLSQFLSKLELRHGTSSNVSSFESFQVLDVELKPKCLGLSSLIFTVLKVYPKASSYFFKWARALRSFKKVGPTPSSFSFIFIFLYKFSGQQESNSDCRSRRRGR